MNPELPVITDIGQYHMISCLQNSMIIQQHPRLQGSWANMGPLWGRQDPGGPHIGPMNLAILDMLEMLICYVIKFYANKWLFKTIVWLMGDE